MSLASPPPQTVIVFGASGDLARRKLFPALTAADRFTLNIGSETSVFPLEGADFESLLRVCAKR